MGKIVGIDLGTTNSVVAVLENGEPTVIPLAEGSRLCPSVVGFSRTGERLVGQLAKRQAVSNPDRTIASIKRHMGEAGYHVAIDGQELTPQEISAMILQKLKTDAESFLGETVDRAVITVPAYFNDGQRQATKDAGQIAGLTVLRIINEPTAAALAYGIDKTDVHTVLVWDLGGGTFDVSILELGDGVFEVKASGGDTRLGGDDWDDRVIEWMASEFASETGVDLRRDRIALQRLREAAERAKIELSTVVTSNVNLPFISTTGEGPVHLDLSLTRAQFEALTGDLRDRMRAPTETALSDARLTAAEIDRVLLVGGSTRMPAVQQMVRELFGKEPFKGTNPDEVVALGAAVQAGVLGGEVRDVVLLDVTPLSLGIETLGGVTTRLIPRNTTIPTSASQVFTTAADGQTAVDIHVVQGEREFAAENKSLGRFQLREITAAARGVPKVEVTFEIDANGIVSVNARDKATGREQRVTLTAAAGLTRDEVDRMIREAAGNATADRARRDTQEARNAANTRLYEGEKTLSEAAGRVAPDVVQAARSAADALRRALASETADGPTLRQQTDAFLSALYAVSSALYGSSGRPTASTAPAAPFPPAEGGYDLGFDADDAALDPSSTAADAEPPVGAAERATPFSVNNERARPWGGNPFGVGSGSS